MGRKGTRIARCFIVAVALATLCLAGAATLRGEEKMLGGMALRAQDTKADMDLRRTIAGKKNLGKVLGSKRGQVDKPGRTQVDDQVVDSAQVDDNQVDKPERTEVDNEVIVSAFLVDEDWDEQTAEEDLEFVENPVCPSEDKTVRFVESKADLKFIKKFFGFVKKVVKKVGKKKIFGLIKKGVKKIRKCLKKGLKKCFKKIWKRIKKGWKKFWKVIKNKVIKPIIDPEHKKRAKEIAGNMYSVPSHHPTVVPEKRIFTMFQVGVCECEKFELQYKKHNCKGRRE